MTMPVPSLAPRLEAYRFRCLPCYANTGPMGRAAPSRIRAGGFSARVVKVSAKDTSRTCHACGHIDPASRQSQATFQCVACGHADHADANAARNIRRRGLALLHGEERSAKPTPLTRETHRRLAA